MKAASGRALYPRGYDESAVSAPIGRRGVRGGG